MLNSFNNFRYSSFNPFRLSITNRQLLSNSISFYLHSITSANRCRPPPISAMASPTKAPSQGFEREVAEAEKDSSDEHKSACLLRLSWALVYSKRPEDVQHGIAMLEETKVVQNGFLFNFVVASSLPHTSDPLQTREKMYLLAVGYYRSGDYTRSRQLVDRCLEIAADWRQAINLKRAIEDQIKKDGVIGTGIAATAVTAVGLMDGGLVAAFARKK